MMAIHLDERNLVHEMATALRMSPRTIERYVSKCLNFGEVKPITIERPIISVTSHVHARGILIMQGISYFRYSIEIKHNRL